MFTLPFEAGPNTPPVTPPASETESSETATKIVEQVGGPPKLEETAAPEAPTVEEPTETATPTVQETTETTETPKHAEDLSEYTSYSRIMYSMRGAVLPEDLDIPKDLDANQFKDFLWEQAKQAQVADQEAYIKQREAEAEAKLLAKGYDEATLAYAQRLAYGGSPEIISRHAQYKSLAETPLDGEDVCEDIVRAGLQVRGNAPELIETYMKEEMKDPDRLKKTAEEYQKFFNSLAEAEFEEEEKQQAAARQNLEKQKEEFAKMVQQTVKNGFLGLKVPAAEQAALVDYIIKDTVQMDALINGRQQRVEVSQFNADAQALPENIEKLVALAHFMRGGMTGVVNAAHKAANDRFLEGIEIEEGVQKEAERQEAAKARTGAPYMSLTF